MVHWPVQNMGVERITQVANKYMTQIRTTTSIGYWKEKLKARKRAVRSRKVAICGSSKINDNDEPLVSLFSKHLKNNQPLRCGFCRQDVFKAVVIRDSVICQDCLDDASEELDNIL